MTTIERIKLFQQIYLTAELSTFTIFNTKFEDFTTEMVTAHVPCLIKSNFIPRFNRWI